MTAPKVSAWNSFLIGILLAVGWLATDHYRPWTSFHSEVPAALAGAVAVFHALRGRASVGIAPEAATLLLLSILPWLQRAAGIVLFDGDALLASLYLCGTGLCLWAGGASTEAERSALLRTLVLTIVAVSIASTGVGLCQWFGIDGPEGSALWAVRLTPGARTAGNLAQSNHVATLIAFGIAGVIWLRANGRVGGAVACLTLAFLLLGLAMTQSRTIWVSGPLLAGWMVCRPGSMLRPLRLSAPAVLLLGSWYAVALSAAVALPEHLQLADASASTAGRLTSGAGRQVMWSSWWHAIELSPWVGHGWQQGHLAQGAAAPMAFAYAYSGYAHNIFLDLLAWNGLPLGGGLSILAVAWYLRAGLRVNGADQWFRFAVLTLFACHALVEYPHAYAYFLVPVALLTGQQIADAPQTRWPVPRFALAVLATACLGSVAAIVHDYLEIEADTRVLRAEKLHIGGVRTSEPPNDILVLDQMYALAKALRTEAQPGMAAASLDELLRVVHRFPMRYLLQETVAALALNGRETEARAEMQRLYGMYGPTGHAAALTWLRDRGARVGGALPAFVGELEAAGPPALR